MIINSAEVHIPSVELLVQERCIVRPVAAFCMMAFQKSRLCTPTGRVWKWPPHPHHPHPDPVSPGHHGAKILVHLGVVSELMWGCGRQCVRQTEMESWASSIDTPK